MEPIEARPAGIAYCLRVGDPLLLTCPANTSIYGVEPQENEGFHALRSASDIQKLKEEFDANEETKRRGVPIVYASAIDRDMPVIALIGHFRVQSELFGEHIIGAPAESPGEVVAGGNCRAAEAVHVDANAHIRIRNERSEPNRADLNSR